MADANQTVTDKDAVSELDENQSVVFELGKEEFGIDINSVKEIVRLPEITPIPRSPDYVSGICNLRGNVLPVIDTRLRFSIPQEDATDQTRLLVVESAGTLTSLLVDNVKEVMRIKHSSVEEPPAVCRGVDKEFLNGVVKVDEGKRLIMMLNLGEVICVDMTRQADTASQGGGIERESQKEDISDEEQLVSFRVGKDEYAFDIIRVSEILKVQHITVVPNVPDYVLGLFTIRNHLLPILDMRRLLGLPSLISEYHNILDGAVEEESLWFNSLKNAIEAGTRFSGDRTARDTIFGRWLEAYNTSSVEVEVLVKRLKRERSELFALGLKALADGEKNKEEGLEMVSGQLEPALKVVLDSLAEIKVVMAAHIQEDQRTMVVESNAVTLGYLVDWVDEVLRIPKSVIDETPAMAASDRRELKSVAKLDDGKRLIMIMDESALISQETRDMLTDIKSKAGTKSRSADEKEMSLAQQSMDEEQLVTFSINQEEYGVQIMEVQEINRVTEITHVPRAPYFIDGMTNLRGSVIPVLNIRKLFGLEDVEVDDRTRIIIVDIGGHRTGLRVDQVNEVLRLSKQDIDDTPAIVTEEGTSKLMTGICKIDNGKRMIVMLDVNQMLDPGEVQKLRSMTQKNQAGDAGKSKEPPAQPETQTGSLSIAE